VTEALLDLREVSIEFQVDTGSGWLSAVDQLSLEIAAGEIFGLVGESGCGKTTLAMAIIGLLAPNARIRGTIGFRGTDLARLPETERRKLRGGQIGMVFQDPLSSLDPAFSVGSQVSDTIQVHARVSGRDARARALELLREVGIPSPEQRFSDPPHRFSGGMRQRVVIAAALANDPALLLADEPTTALDVTIQAQILLLLRALADEHHTTIVLIAHDLGVVAQLCERVGVMYAGQLVEVATVADLYAQPLHPYTRALLAALPKAEHAPGNLAAVEGQVPDLTDPPPGCRFAPRCPQRMAACAERPVPVTTAGGHSVSCWLYPPAA
jgi:oligopeptide/dipeptide ABC transporter ATP-binding protein